MTEAANPEAGHAEAGHAEAARAGADQRPDGGYWRLRQDVGALAWARDVVRVAGPDAVTFLQGQTSQDITGLAVGQWAWCLVLQPQGKLDAFGRAFRAGDDEVYLDTDAGAGAALAQRLLRFRLRVKVEVELLERKFLAVRGPQAQVPSPAPPGCSVIGFSWGGVQGYDVVGPEPAWPPGVPKVTADAFDCLLVESGFPRLGRELDQRTIPAEAGLVGPCVSFTKGCYTGQELVARIDSRGNNVPRRLVGLRSGSPLVVGRELVVEAPGQPVKTVGLVTSAARSPRLGHIGLAYLSRAAQPGQELWALNPEDGAEVPVRAAELPM